MDIPRLFNITESAHRIHNPFTPDKFATLGAALRLEQEDRVLDLACGSGEMLCTWARDYGIVGTGVDMSQLFSAQAKRRAEALGVAERVEFIHGDAAGYVSGEKVDVPDLEDKHMQYLYSDGEGYIFMDNETFEQMSLTPTQVGDDNLGYLKENVEVDILLHNGRPIGLEMPMFMELKIVETDPGIRGNTASGGSKPARLETGATVQVPLFLSEGEVIKVDTRTGDYIERVS